MYVVTTLQSGNAQNIYDSCRNGNVDNIKTLYSQNPSIVNKKNSSGYSPLMLAAYHGKLEVVKFLINKVANIDEDSKYGTPLMAAVVKGHSDIAKLLINNKADVNFADANGTTSLHYATMFKFYPIVEYLLAENIKTNLKDNRGNTALDYAKLLKDKKLINLLTK